MMRRVFEHLATGDLDERTIARSGPLTLALLHFSHIHLFTSHPPTSTPTLTYPHHQEKGSLAYAPPLTFLVAHHLICCSTTPYLCPHLYLPSITKLVGVWQERQIFEKKVSHPSPLIIIEPER